MNMAPVKKYWYVYICIYVYMCICICIYIYIGCPFGDAGNITLLHTEHFKPDRV